MKLSKTKKEKLILKKFQTDIQKNLVAQKGLSDLIIVLDHLKSDFNIGKILRSSYAFGVNEVLIVGTKFFDPYPSKGAIKRIPIQFFQDIDECKSYLLSKDYTIYLFDVDASENLHETIFPKKSAFVFTHEEFGASEKTKASISNYLKIKQVGEINSLNVSVAASLAIYQYTLNFPQ